MLGKCIKNEFTNRWKSILSVLGGLLIFSVVVYVFDTLAKNVISNSYFHTITKILIFVYILSFLAAAFGLIFLPFNDFRNRFFKDQGYLTHTLPVKTSTLILGKIICDLIMILLMVSVYALSIIIATGEFHIFGDLLDIIEELMHFFGTPGSRALLIATVAAALFGFFLNTLFSIWQMNLAYSFGHMFNSGKRILSVCGYVAIWSIFSTFTVILNMILQIPAINDKLQLFLTNLNEDMSIHPEAALPTLFITISILDIIMLVSVVLLAVGTGLICKHRLNLE